MQTFKKKLKALKEISKDLRLRMTETEERPKAIASILQSLNLTSTFLVSMKNLPDSKEIYTEKDFKDIEKLFEGTKVSDFSFYFFIFVIKYQSVFWTVFTVMCSTLTNYKSARLANL